MILNEIKSLSTNHSRHHLPVLHSIGSYLIPTVYQECNRQAMKVGNDLACHFTGNLPHNINTVRLKVCDLSSRGTI